MLTSMRAPETGSPTHPSRHATLRLRIRQPRRPAPHLPEPHDPMRGAVPCPYAQAGAVSSRRRGRDGTRLTTLSSTPSVVRGAPTPTTSRRRARPPRPSRAATARPWAACHRSGREPTGARCIAPHTQRTARPGRPHAYPHPSVCRDFDTSLSEDAEPAIGGGSPEEAKPFFPLAAPLLQEKIGACSDSVYQR
jgi:hypothetical protein